MSLTVTTTGLTAHTSTTTYTTILSTSSSTSLTTSFSTQTIVQTGVTTIGTTSASSTSIVTSRSTISSIETVTVSETDSFNVFLTTIFHELHQLADQLMQVLGIQVTATPMGQQVNSVIVTVPQVTMTVNYQVNGGGSGYSAPVFNYVQEGVSKQLTLSSTPTAVSVDKGSTWSVTNPLQGSTSSERWWVSRASAVVTSTQTINFAYQNQYHLTMSANPSAGGKASPASGWENAGAAVTIQATPSSNFAFLSWTGSGTGSYSGTVNPSTLTMNGPITQTGNFQQSSGQLSISLISPKKGIAITSSPVSLSISVANSVQGASITVFVDGSQICSGSTDSTGSFSCNATVSKTGETHSWYAVASKTGFTSDTSPTWTFKY
jgi:hypothetical protein